MIKLEQLDSITGATYNPRKSDEERLALVALSLRKLGWLLPVYASRCETGGEIISGHQRCSMAAIAGYERVPVEWLAPMDLAKRKGLNIAFNRGTCDMEATSQTTAMRRELLAANVQEMASRIPDVDVNNEREAFPCMFAQREEIGPLLRANAGRWSHHAKTMARRLTARGASMPAIVGPDNVVVNGIGRLEYAAEQKETTVPVVRLDADRAAFARLMLNLLSMDFDIENRYADLLRYNSFRRAHHVRSTLGTVFTFFAFGGRVSKTVDLSRNADFLAWTSVYGKSLLDFGAGHFSEVQMLRKVGIDADGFEPFMLTPVTIDMDPPLARKLTRELLAKVAAGKVWDSVVLATVLNSVPFAADRRHIVRICAALCGPKTVLFSGCSSEVHPMWKDVAKEYLNGVNDSSSKFVLDYEPGVTIGDVVDSPKVQKYHTRKEVAALFGEFFSRVKIQTGASLYMSMSAAPRPITWADLEESLRFEFDLAYPDGTRMGLSEEAISAFRARRARLGNADG